MPQFFYGLQLKVFNGRQRLQRFVDIRSELVFSIVPTICSTSKASHDFSKKLRSELSRGIWYIRWTTSAVEMIVFSFWKIATRMQTPGTLSLRQDIYGWSKCVNTKIWLQQYVQVSVVYATACDAPLLGAAMFEPYVMIKCFGKVSLATTEPNLAQLIPELELLRSPESPVLSYPKA